MSETATPPSKTRLTRWWWFGGGAAVFVLMAFGFACRYPHLITASQIRISGARVIYPTFPSPTKRPHFTQQIIDFFESLDAEPTSIGLTPNMSPSAITTTLTRAKQFRKLRALVASGSRITDDHLQALTAWPELSALRLDKTKISNAGCVHIATCPKLMGISMQDTSIDDAGLESLAPLVDLHVLDVSGTKVTDAGLKYLTGMTRLTIVVVERTRITRAGISSLQAHLPEVNRAGISF